MMMVAKIIDMLKVECDIAGVDRIASSIDKREDGFHITLDFGLVRVHAKLSLYGRPVDTKNWSYWIWLHCSAI